MAHSNFCTQFGPQWYRSILFFGAYFTKHCTLHNQFSSLVHTFPSIAHCTTHVDPFHGATSNKQQLQQLSAAAAHSHAHSASPPHLATAASQQQLQGNHNHYPYAVPTKNQDGQQHQHSYCAMTTTTASMNSSTDPMTTKQ